MDLTYVPTDIMHGSGRIYIKVDPQVDDFLDTQFLVYALGRSAGKKHLQATQLVESCWENGNGCLTEDISHGQIFGGLQVYNPFKEDE